MDDIDKKIIELGDKYFLNEHFDVFTNMNRYGKFFLRINVHLPNESVSRTFNWSLSGYENAVRFIESYERRIKKKII